MSWFEADAPTRGVNISVGPAVVLDRCKLDSAAISALRDLPQGGTRVVLVTLKDADAIRRSFKEHLLPRNTHRTQSPATRP